MNLIVGIVGSLIAAIIIAVAVARYKYVFGQRIKIIDPQLHGFLTTAETRLGVVVHQVHGTLVAVNGSIPADPTSRTLGSGFSAPHGVAVGSSGNVYVIDSNQTTVTELLAVNGVIPANPTIVALEGDFKWAYGIAVDGRETST